MVPPYLGGGRTPGEFVPGADGRGEDGAGAAGRGGRAGGLELDIFCLLNVAYSLNTDSSRIPIATHPHAKNLAKYLYSYSCLTLRTCTEIYERYTVSISNGYKMQGASRT